MCRGGGGISCLLHVGSVQSSTVYESLFRLDGEIRKKVVLLKATYGKDWQPPRMSLTLTLMKLSPAAWNEQSLREVLGACMQNNYIK